MIIISFLKEMESYVYISKHNVSLVKTLWKHFGVTQNSNQDKNICCDKQHLE